MEESLSLRRITSNTIAFDLLMLAAIAFLPALSHMFSFPFSLLDPMRILLIVSIAHTSKQNSFIVAAVLPIFSFVLSSHPAVFKSLLILSELSLNVWLFYLLIKKFNNGFVAMILSIVVCKLYYYAVKYFMVQAGLIEGDLVATSIYLQAIVGMILSVYVYFLWKKNSSVTEN